MQIPGYKIIDTLGEGGMARVYLAIQESFEREVALKVLDPHLSKDPSFGERFMGEARIVSRLVHPNIVTVYDMGVHRDYHYLSMEYVPGRDLKHRRFELTLPECVTVVKEVARALDYAGRKGCVHRDVKPDNIMLHADDGRAVLMDFGIARIVDQTSSMTQTGTTVGTPHYMSPEHARGAPVDSRSDLYSLGVVLFLLLSGHLPYDSDSAVSIGVKHISEQIPLLPRHLVAFQPIIDRVMAKDPDERYQTGSELIDALDQLSPEMLVAMQQEGERALFEQLGGSSATSPTLHQPQAVVAQHDEDLDETDTGEMEQLSVEDEDRVSHQQGSKQKRDKPHRLGMLMLILLSTVGLVALYQWQEPLKTQWDTRVMPWVTQMTGKVSDQASSVVSELKEEPAVERVETTEVSETVEKGAVTQNDSAASANDAPQRDGDLLAQQEPAQAPPFESAEPLPGAANNTEQDTMPATGPSPSSVASRDGSREAITELSRAANDMSTQGDLTGAMALLEEGLETYPESQRLLLQHDRLRERMNRRQQQEGTSEREQAQAVSELATAVSAIEQHLAAGELDRAGERLMQARERYPGSAELLALEVDWRDRQATEMRPVIARTRVSAEPLDAIPGEQLGVLSAGRVLYAGFSYRNFTATSAVIQAVLYDGARQRQIAQVPVIIQGDEGEAFFRIERPVNGFAGGSYHLDLVADNQTLSTVSFQISD